MIDLELTPKIQKWLDADPASRSLSEGAELLLRVTRNKVLFNNISRNLRRHADVIEYQLKKILSQRLNEATRSQVRAMMSQVNAISQKRALDAPEGSSRRSEWQRGRRADHDSLPPEIQQLYVDNADIMRRMREAHLHLRLISPDNSTCPDSDRYPWAKEIIALDTLYRENWNKYDHYIPGAPASQISIATDPRADSRNAARFIHLLLGKYAAAPGDEALANRIRETYARIVSPSDSVTKKMTDAGLL